MKITLEETTRENNLKATVENQSDDIHFSELVELFKSAAVGVGFHQDTVAEIDTDSALEAKVDMQKEEIAMLQAELRKALAKK